MEARAQKSGKKGAHLALFFFIVGSSAILRKFDLPPPNIFLEITLLSVVPV